MRIKFDSFRSRLLLTFLGLSFITVLTAGFSYWFFKTERGLHNLNDNGREALLNSFHLFKIGQDYLDNENAKNFEKDSLQKQLLEQHETLLKRIKQQLLKLLYLEGANRLSSQRASISEDTAKILQNLRKYEAEFKKMVEYRIEMYNSDTGLFKKLNESALELQNTDNEVFKKNFLLLRQAEKDYLIKKDSNEVFKIDSLRESLDKQISQSTDNQLDTKSNWRIYQQSLKRLIALDFLIGVDNQAATRGRLNNYTETTTLLLEKLAQTIRQEVKKIEAWQGRWFIGVVGFMVLLSVFLSYFVAGVVAKPLTRLSQFINQAIQNKFSDSATLPVPNSKDEVSGLTHDFNLMLQEIRNRLAEVREKTQALEQQNGELNQLNQQLHQSEQHLTKLHGVKDKLFSIISHDLRSPLNSMLGFLNILEARADIFTPDETRKFSQETQKSVKRLITLLDNLLQWSLSETGEMVFQPKILNLSDRISENIALYENIAHDKEVELVNWSQKKLKVMADGNMLDFILRNLISNAIKFSNHHSKIIISTQKLSSWVEISVADQGIGMPAENIAKILQAEEHITTRGTDAEKGTGFGLLLCKNFIEKNQGKMMIESIENQGTTIKFTLPIEG
jgi:signal transduction histidine kinase